MLLHNAENLELHHEQEALKTREMGLQSIQATEASHSSLSIYVRWQHTPMFLMHFSQ